jgi:hypothetical protein
MGAAPLMHGGAEQGFAAPPRGAGVMHLADGSAIARRDHATSTGTSWYSLGK